MNRILFLLVTSVLFLSSCAKPEVKVGYVRVPTETEHALSGVYHLLPPAHPTVKLYYEECGQGEPLILIHEQAVDCRMWDNVFLKLAKKFRVIRYDLRGYGHSGNPESGYGYLHADDLKNLMDALGVKKAHFAGVALGGMTLTEFLALYPERVLSVTISSGAVNDYPNRSAMSAPILKIYNDTVFALIKKGVESRKSRGMEAEKKDWKTMFRSSGGKNYREISDPLNKMIDDWKGWMLLNPETDAFMGTQADSMLVRQKKKPPILLLIGQYDSVRNKKSMQRMAVLCPDSKIQLMPTSGRFTCMESPDEFMENLLLFIGKK